MGPVKAIFLLLLCVLSAAVRAQEVAALPWDANRKLTWEDFRARPFETAWAAATTASGISYEYSGKEHAEGYELTFEIGAFFYPDKSWYQPALCNPNVLAHEQLHFDISELFARKMRKEVANTRFTHKARAEVQAIYKKILKDLSEFQARYDRETDYSRNLEKQLLWQEKVARSLRDTGV